MSYTPINWQTGDTITAEKLNKMDNGWGMQETQLFSETVTTEASGGMYQTVLAYSDTIDADSITVTFDGTEYECPRIDAFDQHFYGGFSDQGPTFTDFPFCIASGERNQVYTETAGSYTISVAAEAPIVSDSFKGAVMLASQDNSLEVVKDVTTWEEARDALLNGKRVFLTESDGVSAYQSPAVFASPADYSVGFININGINAQTPTVGWLRASSFDGVLTDM